jgi:hypothetical protein
LNDEIDGYGERNILNINYLKTHWKLKINLSIQPKKSKISLNSVFTDESDIDWILLKLWNWFIYCPFRNNDNNDFRTDFQLIMDKP